MILGLLRELASWPSLAPSQVLKSSQHPSTRPRADALGVQPSGGPDSIQKASALASARKQRLLPLRSVQAPKRRRPSARHTQMRHSGEFHVDVPSLVNQISGGTMIWRYCLSPIVAIRSLRLRTLGMRSCLELAAPCASARGAWRPAFGCQTAT